MSRARRSVKRLIFALAGVGAFLAFGPAIGREQPPAPAPVGYSCFLQNTCPPCKGKPVSRSQKKEQRENCSCHRVTYQCDDGSTKTCWDNCE